MLFEKRTDLAIEVKESFPEDDVEISGVELEENSYDNHQTKITTVKILNESGARQMKKPTGMYITIDFNMKSVNEEEESYTSKVEKRLQDELHKIIKDKVASDATFLVTGLGNRFATPDALGPFVLEKIEMNRHIMLQFPEWNLLKRKKSVCGMSPGVLGQTGIESKEILKGVIENVHPDCLIIIDSLATRSVKRLCSTIQITDTGISPGAGIGNNRSKINEDSMQIPVIAIGVPTVVDASTIVYETLETSLLKEGYTQKEVEMFFQSINKEVGEEFFVTPKDIDEKIQVVGNMIANGINEYLAR